MEANEREEDNSETEKDVEKVNVNLYGKMRRTNTFIQVKPRTRFKLILMIVLLFIIHLIEEQSTNQVRIPNQLDQAKWLKLFAAEASTLADYDGATFYKATVGSRVRIACNGSHWGDDSVGLVLWFKGSNSVPIYTVDARQKPLNQGARHFVSDAYKGRARFNSRATPPYLDLAPLEEEDQAEFRCRIDYRSRPRENFLVILFVLVPPKSVQVIDSNGRPMEQIYGPLSEGSDLTLLCLAKGGRPAPAVIWKQGNKVIDDSYLTLNDFLALRDPKLLASSSFGTNSSASSRPPSRNQRDDISGSNVTPVAPNSISLEDSSSSSSSSLSSLVESLYVEWRQWPEFEYLARQQADSNNWTSVASNGQQDSSFASISTSTDYAQSANDLLLSEFASSSSSSDSNNYGNNRNRQSPGSKSQSATNQPSGRLVTSSQLLELPVHESITTSVNVLRLSSLGSPGSSSPWSAAAHSPQYSDSPLVQNDHLDMSKRDAAGHNTKQVNLTQPTTKLIQQQTYAQFECQASNLHYDLRTLIKLFAPPSLAAGSGQRAGEVPQQEMVSGASSATRQLVDAIERARESAFRSMASGGGIGGNSVLTPSSMLQAAATTSELDRSLSDDNSGNLTAHLAVELASLHPLQLPSPAISSNHLKKEEEDDNSNNNHDHRDKSGTLVQAATSAGLTSASRVNGLVNVIYQQLARPHQLASSQQQQQLLQVQRQQSDPPVSLPLVRTKQVSLDVYLRPLDVKIHASGSGKEASQRNAHSAGHLTEFQCSTSGSRPPAKLTWFLDGKRLEPKLSLQVDEATGNASHSRLSLNLERGHNGASLVCRAENVKLSELLNSRNNSRNQPPLSPLGATAIEDSLQLTVHYPPRLKLELGNRMLSDAIKEFSDIYFVCHVDANPPVKEITWLHNELPINELTVEPMSETQAHSLGASRANVDFKVVSSEQLHSSQHDGLIISNNSLVLQRVKLEQRGHYACVASNSEGLSESNRIKLRVLHAPICRPPPAMATLSPQQRQLMLLQKNNHKLQQSTTTMGNQIQLVGQRDLPLNTKSRFLCRMAADPPEVEITWYLNNSHTERRVLATRQADKIFSPSLAKNRKPQVGSASATATPTQQSPLDMEQSSGPPSSRLKPASYNNNNNKLEETINGDGDESPRRNFGGKPASRKYGGDVAGKVEVEAEKELTTRPMAPPTATEDLVMVSSQLEYLVDSELDYGQLYCVAKNSIGEQKVACVYELQAPDPSDAQPISCLAVNVTATSVSLGCQLVVSQQQQQPAMTQKGYSFSVAVYRVNGRSTKTAPSDTSEFVAGGSEANHVSGDVDGNYGISSSANNDDNDNFFDQDLELEANLDSGHLPEPLFSVTNLKPLSSYELHVYLSPLYDSDQNLAAPRYPSVVRLRTTSDMSLNRQTAQGDSKPKLEPISEQQQQQNLMAALISTRSTSGPSGAGHSIQRTGNHLASGNAAMDQQHGGKYAATGKWKPHQQQQSQRQSDTNFLLDLWSRSLGRLFGVPNVAQVAGSGSASGSDDPASSNKDAANLMSPTGGGSSRPLASRTRGNGNSIAINNQLMDLSDALLITSVCLVLLGSLVALLVLHRYSRLGLCAGRSESAGSETRNCRSSGASSSSTCSSSTAASGKLHRLASSGGKQLGRRQLNLNGCNDSEKNVVQSQTESNASDNEDLDEDRASGDSNVHLMQQVNLAALSSAATGSGCCDISQVVAAANVATQKQPPQPRPSFYPSATLDARLLSRQRYQANGAGIGNITTTAGAPAQAQQLHLSNVGDGGGARESHHHNQQRQFGLESQRYGLQAARVSRSRSTASVSHPVAQQQESSFTVDGSHSNGAATAANQAALQSSQSLHQQQRLIQLSNQQQQQQHVNGCSLERIISDANLQPVSFMSIAELQAAAAATNSYYATAGVAPTGNNDNNPNQMNSLANMAGGSPIDLASTASISSTATTTTTNQQQLQLYCNGSTNDCFSSLNPHQLDGGGDVQVYHHQHQQLPRRPRQRQRLLQQRPNSSSIISDEPSGCVSNGFSLHHHHHRLQQQVQWSELVTANGQQHSTNSSDQVNFIHLLHPAEISGNKATNLPQSEYIESSDLLLERLMVANDHYNHSHHQQSYFANASTTTTNTTTSTTTTAEANANANYDQQQTSELANR